MNLLAQLLGALGTVTDVIGIQLKRKKQILLAYIISNLLFTVSFYLLGVYSGVITCIIMATETYIDYLFGKNKKTIPKWLIYIMMIGAIGIAGLFYETWIDFLSIAACIPFVLMLVQTKEKNIRLLALLYFLLYGTFDIFAGAYTAFVGDILFGTSTVIAIIRYDLIKRNQYKNIKFFDIIKSGRNYKMKKMN